MNAFIIGGNLEIIIWVDKNLFYGTYKIKLYIDAII